MTANRIIFIVEQVDDSNCDGYISCRWDSGWLDACDGGRCSAREEEDGQQVYVEHAEHVVHAELVYLCSILLLSPSAVRFLS